MFFVWSFRVHSKYRYVLLLLTLGSTAVTFKHTKLLVSFQNSWLLVAVKWDHELRSHLMARNLIACKLKIFLWKLDSKCFLPYLLTLSAQLHPNSKQLYAFNLCFIWLCSMHSAVSRMYRTLNVRDSVVDLVSQRVFYFLATGVFSLFRRRCSSNASSCMFKRKVLFANDRWRAYCRRAR